jgi:hypothetical protein
MFSVFFGTISHCAWRPKQYQAVSDGARAHILHAMGGAAIGTLRDGAYKRKLVERKGYSVEPTEYIDFRFSRSTKKPA